MSPEDIYRLTRLMRATNTDDDEAALAAIRAANRIIGQHDLDWDCILGSPDVDHSNWPIHADLSRKMVALLGIQHRLSPNDLADLDRLIFLVGYRRLTGEEVFRLANMHMRAEQ